MQEANLGALVKGALSPLAIIRGANVPASFKRSMLPILWASSLSACRMSRSPRPSIT
jgi:hypothetical protein